MTEERVDSTWDLDGPWRNDACMGYALMAMHRAGVDGKTIGRVMTHLNYCFDEVSVEDAAEYCGDGEM